MKKFLTCMFAAMLFVPTFAGCGESNEAETLPDDPNQSNTGDMSPEDYEAKMQEADQKAQEENQD